MSERSPKPHAQYQPEIFNRRIKKFVNDVMSVSEIETSPGSTDSVSWVKTDMKAAVVQTRLEESEVKGLLVPKTFFESSHVREEDLRKVRMRVRKKEWYKFNAEEGNENPEEMNWEAGIGIKLRYEGKNNLSVRQLITVTTELKNVTKSPQIKRTFVPSEADGEELDEYGGRTFILSDKREPLSSKDLYKTVKGTPEQVIFLINLAQEIYDKRKEY